MYSIATIKVEVFRGLLIGSLACFLFSLAALTDAQNVPQLINYQGTLLDNEGELLTGEHDISFSIYDAVEGGEVKWGPKLFNDVDVIEGQFNVILGEDNTGKSIIDAFNGHERYIEITVDGNIVAIRPRQQLLSAPYAIVADQLGDQVFVDEATKAVGIGTQAPEKKLTVVGTANSDPNSTEVVEGEIQLGLSPNAGGIRYEGGKMQFSNDGGDTWSEMGSGGDVLRLVGKATDPNPNDNEGVLFYREPVPEGENGIDENTTLLLHMDGSNGAINFEDSSPFNHKDFVIAGDAKMSTELERWKFGGSSASFDRNKKSFISIPAHSNWNWGSEAFTIDFWIRFNEIAVEQTIVGQYRSNSSHWFLRMFGSKMEFSSDSSDINLKNDTNDKNGDLVEWFTGKLYHIALVHEGNMFWLFRDGVMIGRQETTDDLGDFKDKSFDIATHLSTSEGAHHLNGYIDELRISKGVARWKSSFNPPEFPYDKGGLYFKDKNNIITELAGAKSFAWSASQPWQEKGFNVFFLGGKVGIDTDDPQGTLDVNGTIFHRGLQQHADYVFEPDFELESIEEHAEYMWKNKHLKAVPPRRSDENGYEVIEVGSHRKGMLEELEKAHIYIEQLHKRNKELEQRLSRLESKIEGMQSEHE